MKRNEILEKLKEILLAADNIKKESILCADENTKLASELGLSSFMMLFLAIAIEETFKIKLEKNCYKDFVSIGNVIDYIEKGMENK